MLTNALQALVRAASGLHLDRPTVQRAAGMRMREIGIDGMGLYLARLGADAAEMKALLELLVVPETWLFRDPQAFAAAAAASAALAQERAALPGRPVRLLSLPCATGEEPYSLVMALLDAGLQPSRFTVDAIDISSAALARAEVGLYRQNAFRSDDLSFRERYFTAVDGGGFQLAAAVRSQVRFSQGNLMTMAAGTPAQRYDIIFCRNLLIYFDASTQAQAIGILDRLLADDGLLFSGYAELPVFTANGFTTAHLRRAYALRKLAFARRTAATGPIAASTAARPVLVPGVPPPLTPIFNSPAAAQPVVQPKAPVAAARLPASQPTAPASSDEPLDRLLEEATRLADAGALAAAGERLEACLRTAPDSAPAYAMRGAVHAAQREPAEAERCLRRALYLDPQQYEVICQLAVLADGRGDAEAARTLRGRAARLRARQEAAAPGSGSVPGERGSADLRTARTGR